MGAHEARAGSMQAVATGIPIHASLGAVRAWDAQGLAWHRVQGEWARDVGDLPMPVTEVAFMESNATSTVLVSTSGEIFSGSGGEWTSLGTLPTGPVAVDHGSWGKVKAAHR